MCVKRGEGKEWRGQGEHVSFYKAKSSTSSLSKYRTLDLTGRIWLLLQTHRV